MGRGSVPPRPTLASAPSAPMPGLWAGIPHLLKSRSLEGVPGSPGKNQKEGQERQVEVQGQEDQGVVLMAFLLALSELPGNPSSYPYLEASLYVIESSWKGLLGAIEGVVVVPRNDRLFPKSACAFSKGQHKNSQFVAFSE